jgi:hypothetical protein
MVARNRAAFGLIVGFALLLSFAFGGGGPSAAQELGLAAKKPVVAAACKLCPWGTIADVLKEALKPQGYDLQICYTCSRGNNPRYVVGRPIRKARRRPPNIRLNSASPRGRASNGCTRARTIMPGMGDTRSFG